MSIRLSASAFALVSLLAAPAFAVEPATPAPSSSSTSSSWSGYVVPVVVGGALGAVAVPYLYPTVAPAVGGALVTAGGAAYGAAPAVGTAVLEGAAVAGSYAAAGAQSANTYLLAQTVQAQTIIGAALGGLIGWNMAGR